MSGFLAALIVCVIAGLTALMPIIFAAAYNRDMLSVSALAAAVIRLLLMIAGSAIVIVFVKVDTLRFIIWAGVFYLVVLVLEVLFAIRVANSNNVSGGGKV